MTLCDIILHRDIASRITLHRDIILCRSDTIFHRGFHRGCRGLGGRDILPVYTGILY